MPYFGELSGKIKLLNTHNLLCRNFQLSVGILQLLFPPIFLAHDADDVTVTMSTALPTVS